MTAEGVRIREAAPQDLQAVSCQVAASYRAAYQGLMREDYLAALTDDHWVPLLQTALEEGGTCLIALHGAETVGSIVFGDSKSDPGKDTAEVFALYLLPAYIGTGLGQGLYCEAERLMLEQGASACVAEALRENTRSLGFCAKQGFQVIGDFSVEENGMLLHCKTLRKEWKKGRLI